MTTAVIFRLHLIFGYIAWFLCFGAYIWPKLKTMSAPGAQRAIAVLHSFRFFGLVFIVPGVVGAGLPQRFAEFAAWGDFATGLLAMAALVSFRMRPLFYLFVVAFNVVGIADLLADYFNATVQDLPAVAGQLGAAYVIPIIYVPILMITHWAALVLLVRSARGGAITKESELSRLDLEVR